jgi:hypothetical protein
MEPMNTIPNAVLRRLPHCGHHSSERPMLSECLRIRPTVPVIPDTAMALLDALNTAIPVVS